VAKITLGVPYQSISGAWYVPWWTDTGQRNERKYVGKLPGSLTILSDVQKYLDAMTVSAAEEVIAAKQAVVDAQKASLAGMAFSVVDAKGLPIVGATVKVTDAETKVPLADVATTAGVNP